MNQRMIELYKQAQEFAYKNISKESWNTDNFHAVVAGKFAQLIVKECASMVDTYGRWILYDKLAVKLKKDFGIEE